MLLPVRLPAQAVAGPAPAPGIISNAQVFLRLSEADKQKPQQVRFEMLVYYYDPFWQLMWGECENTASFLPVRGEPLPIKPGQRVRLEGMVLPARGILRNEVTVTVLEENALPPPQPTQGELAASPKFDAQWVALEGYVCQQREIDQYHLEYQVLTEGWLVTVRVLVRETEPVPQLVNRRVRFHGVYIGTLDTDRKLQRIDLWVPHSTDVTILGDLAHDPRFQLPRTPLDRLAAAKRMEWVRVEGEVREFKPGRSLTFRDETGQLTVETPQPGSLKIGDRVELVGRPFGAGLGLTLAEAHFRPSVYRSVQNKSGGAGDVPRFSLRVVEQIMELPLGEVARGYFVTLRGAVTWSDPRVNFFYLQDATGGVCIRLKEGDSPPAINDSVEIRGATNLGRYAPEVQLREMSPLGPVAPPAARPVTLEQTLTGAEEACRVELRGYVRQVTLETDWSRLDLTTNSGELSAFLPPDKTLAKLTGAMVRIAGVCSVEANNLRQLTGVRLWASGKEAVEVEEPAPADPFSAPRYTIAGLNQFTRGGTLNRRVTVTGLVLLRLPGRCLLLQDGESGLMVLSRETNPLAPGTAVEISGLPGRDGSRLVLREAVTRAAFGGSTLQPILCRTLTETKPELDVRLVQLRAVLNDVVKRPQGVRLSLQAGGALFDAVLEPAAGWRAPAPGSLLELTGVYLLEFDEYHRPRGFRLQLRTPGDVRIVSAPSWWTARRAFAVAGGLAACLGLGIVWVAVLRRRVRGQTEQLRRHMEKEARLQAELERSSRLDSLGVLAGGIAHDFNNMLTAILGNLGLMRMEKEAMERVGPLVGDAERAAKRAGEITQQLLTFAKGGDPVRTAVDLQEVVREAAEFVRHDSNVKVEFEIEPGLPPAEVDASQISRVAHNLVLNAVQAMPGGGLVRIALDVRKLRPGEIPPLAPGRYLQLKISDTGPGIGPEKLPRIFDPYFSAKVKGSGLGLAIAHSIVKNHKGHIEVDSTLGRGTSFCVWLPAAHGPQAGKTEMTGFTQSGASARVLFMDDEESVCLVAGAILRHCGHTTTVVHDGAAAVEAFQQARNTRNPFDLVILDLTVPGGMGGREALVELRQIDPAVRVIASSGYSQDPVMANHRAYGFTAVLPKPYDPDSVAQVINEVHRP